MPSDIPSEIDLSKVRVKQEKIEQEMINESLRVANKRKEMESNMDEDALKAYKQQKRENNEREREKRLKRKEQKLKRREAKKAAKLLREKLKAMVNKKELRIKQGGESSSLPLNTTTTTTTMLVPSSSSSMVSTASTLQALAQSAKVSPAGNGTQKRKYVRKNPPNSAEKKPKPAIHIRASGSVKEKNKMKKQIKKDKMEKRIAKLHSIVLKTG